MNASKCAGCPQCSPGEGGHPFCDRYSKPCRGVNACGVANRKTFNKPFSKGSARAARRFHEQTERGEK